MEIDLQFFGGRGAGSNAVSESSAGVPVGQRITGGKESGDFTQTADGVWESEAKSYSAAMLAGPNREAKGILEPRYTIVEGEYKGNKVFRLYQQHVGRKEFLKRFKTPKEAVKWVNS